MHSEHSRISAVLEDIAHLHAEGESITVGEFIRTLSDRAFGLAILLFAIPNMPPIGIPGISSICAVPIALFALQYACGRSTLWLPGWLARRSLPQRGIALGIRKVLPAFRWLERWLKPNRPAVFGRAGDVVTALLMSYLAFIMFLPIPGGNFMAAISIGIMALAILEHDGRLLIIGWAAGLFSAIFMSSVISAGIAFFSAKLWSYFGYLFTM